jgi:cytochrome c
MTRMFTPFLVALLASWPALAQDAQRGRQLYETHCLTCHYERIHKRDRAKSLVRSLAGLRVEVARRAEQVTPRLAIEDLDDISEYLNRSHYRFDR